MYLCSTYNTDFRFPILAKGDAKAEPSEGLPPQVGERTTAVARVRRGKTILPWVTTKRHAYTYFEHYA